MGIRILENEYLKVTVADHGAELISVYDKENDTERMWDANPQAWNRHAPILFPFVGKLNRGEYHYNGRKYEMKTQHGFARDKDFICTAEDGSSVTHCLKADEDTRAIYPFEFELCVTHSLDQENPRKLQVQWEIKNLGDTKMQYSIGAHPGFKTPAGENEKREDYYIEFVGKDSAEYILLDEGLAVTERVYTLELDGGFLPIGEHLFDKDALIFEDGQIDKVRIAKPDKSPYITMECEGFPYFGLWSKPEVNPDFVCLEPWMGRTDDRGFDGPLELKAGGQELGVNEVKTVAYTVEFHR